MKESVIEKRLGSRLKALGCLWLKFVSPGNRGVPDRICILPGGKIYFVELKADTGRLVPLQERWQGRLCAQGCVAFVLRGEADAERFYKLVYEEVWAK